MKADTFNAIDRLFAPMQMILKIPVYQRNYDWTETNVRRLLDDIKTVVQDHKSHFIGAIVYMESQNSDLGMPEYLIIDGQQRLTTITLLLQALKDLCGKDDQQAADMIESFLTNKYSPDEYKIKLKPIKSDNVQYEALLNNKPDKIDQDGHVYKNYMVAKKTFKSWIESGIKPIEILTALRQLQVVGISLKKGEDDPQIIFESINSTGVALTNSDLIRNFLLMSDHDQDRLFEEYWLPIEDMLRRNNDNYQLDLFFRQYVIMKSHTTVAERKVYSTFVTLFKENEYTHESALQELKKYVEIYSSFLYPEESSYSDEVKGYLADLKQLNQTTCYPFLMHLFADFENQVIDEQTLNKALRLITIYLIRRSICNIPTNSLNGLFAYLYSRVFRISANKDKYYEALNKYLFAQNNKNAVPDDEQLRFALVHNNFYQNLPLSRLLMLDIENGDTKEKLSTGNLTIKHIMPQTLSKSWRQYISDKDHEEYVHTLGNLSITGYNSEMSNKSFEEKKKILKQNSRVQILNEDVVDKDKWTIQDITNRSKRLADILIKKYHIDQVVDPKIEFENVDKIYLSDPGAATNRKPVSFTLEGSNYSVKTFKDITIKLINILDQDDPSRLVKLVGLNWKGNFDSPNANNKLIICRKEDIDNKIKWHYAEVRDGVYVMLGGPAATIMHVLKELIDFYDINENDFSISVRAKK
ncbi:DUF262 domain-containing protein [Lactobacillus crispatus]|uniref:DUF262 domain-containing protein n=1 Tax=Lactobacillus crispatus TaxID=47770 RepID=A0A2N5L087_9LACO|nr:DUF262 domain-containing protein [Lactobacillus crispatus]MDK7320775.1 DUF262 domain-containing HNH endonuclease family protein [Lactobacillus crispatus]MDK8273153.1 DUF262 domain-containing HNH endonuclease family protein [Lactobacillus crispatus]MDK8569244.1 DUF262 domain-containing HNH endonuclease family protein [Lactobacillus crispatus]PLT11843.1 DUF262 domain-containing protein [Lactobacillus crispatus]PLT12794.1 DUF262 domain-containing protein [Lactobacillus crispatus]